MKALIFRHYFKRAMTDPMGMLIITVLPTALIIIMSMVIAGTVEGDIMVQGYNMVATQLAILFTVSFQFFGGNVLLDYLYLDFRGDRRFRLFSAPVKNNDYIFGALGACLLFTMVQGIIVILITEIFLDVYWGNPLVLFGVLLASSCLAQLLYMLLFLIFPKKGTAELVAQVIISAMMGASEFFGGALGLGADSASLSPVQSFLLDYGTPISLARRAITYSGFLGDNLLVSLESLGILLGLAILLGAIVAMVGKKKGFGQGETQASPRKTEAPKKENLLQEKEIYASKTLNLVTPLMEKSVGAGWNLTIFRFALLRGMRNILSLIFNAVLPLAIIFMPDLWTWEHPTGFYFMGMLLMYGAFMATRGILNDRLDGSILRIHAAPVSSFRYLLQNLLASMVPLAVQIWAVSLIGFVRYGWATSFTLLLALLYLTFAIASVALSFAWSCLFKEREVSYALFSVIMSLVALLSGFWFPLDLMPSALRHIGALFPSYWTSNGILALVSGGATGEYWLSTALILLFSGPYLLFGTKRRII